MQHLCAGHRCHYATVILARGARRAPLPGPIMSVTFRQLFEPVSSTYTYLLACADSRQAVLIDPVITMVERDLAELAKLGLTLSATLDTHIHADHITGALELKRRAGSRIAAPGFDRLPCADVAIEEGKPFQVGNLALHPIHTPGHTDGHFAYAFEDRVFTGDALLIEGCGRTDFQNGDAAALFASVTGKLFALPDDFLVYPAHDYKDRRVSSIKQEKLRNPRLGQGIDLARFKEIMAGLNLPYPKFIDYAVPGNRRCGVCPQELPDQLADYCHAITHSPQG